jgi:hypothetical protein
MIQLPTILNHRDLEQFFPNPYQTTNDDERQERKRKINEGKKVRVIGRYAQVDVRKKQDPPPLYQGHKYLNKINCTVQSSVIFTG